MYGYGHNSNYGYGYGGSAASGTPAGLAGVYGNYAGSANAAGYTQAPSSAYGYGTTATTFGPTAANYKHPSADHTYGVGKARMPNNAPMGFTSAGTLSSTQAALSSLYPQQSVTAAAVNALNANVSSGTHYEGYESAVLAVTTDFLHKTQGPNWVNGGPGNYPNGTFPKKRPGFGHHQRPPPDPGAYYCETCKISCAGPKAYTEHLAGKNHKKREAIESGKNQINLPKNKITFRCDICELTCTGKDTYDAHVKGSRHLKTLNLLKKLGKPLPASEPTIIPPQQNSKQEPGSEVEGNSGGPKPSKVVGVTGTQFVAGSTLTTVTEPEKEAIEAALEAESQIQPLGEEYVEARYDQNGKLTEFHCKLCDCSFSDPNAKAVHTKGRRHRLSYKNKVDSSIRVELKQSVVTARMKKEKKIQKEASKNFFNHPQGSFPHQWFDADNSLFSGNQESVDDRHILTKYEELKMDEAVLQDIHRLVEMVEKALKAASDVFTLDFFNSPDEGNEIGKESEENGKSEEEKILKGLMKVGLFASGLLMKKDNIVDLVLLTSRPPTKWALLKVAELLKLHFDPVFKDKLNVSTDLDSGNFAIEVDGFPATVKVSLTCALMREYEGKDESKVKEELPKDHLPLNSCLSALAELRRTKWYQAKALSLDRMNIIMTVLRDIRERVSTWEPLTIYMLALFTQNVLESFGFPMTPGDERAAVIDPCEKEKVDAMEPLNRQQREDITSSAQHALRLIVFDQIEKILDMERLQEKNENGRKRATDTQCAELGWVDGRVGGCVLLQHVHFWLCGCAKNRSGGQEKQKFVKEPDCFLSSRYLDPSPVVIIDCFFDSFEK
ncbi:hypothetical protein FO519_006934, partial [Halicephalobus sp. NKZ332]